MRNILTIFTSPTAVGVTIRNFLLVVAPLITMLGWLTPEQIEDLQSYLGSPELAGAIAAVIAAVVYIYGVITKSRSVKADAASKEIDKEVPKEAPVKIETADGVLPAAPIVVTEEGKVLK